MLDSSKICVECEESWPMFLFNTPSNWKKADLYGIGSKCVFCRRLYRMKKYHERWEEERAWSDAWKMNNKDKCREHERNRDKEKKRVNDQNYRSRKVNAPGALTIDAVRLMHLVFGKKCLKCGATEDITIDHIVPLNKGGSNYIYNLQPLCRSCNSAKRDYSCADYRTWELA